MVSRSNVDATWLGFIFKNYRQVVNNGPLACYEVIACELETFKVGGGIFSSLKIRFHRIKMTEVLVISVQKAACCSTANPRRASRAAGWCMTWRITC